MVAGERTRSAAVGATISAATAETGPISLADAMAVLTPLEAVWTGPGEPTIVTSGRIETLTAGGEGRFTRIRKLATELFERVDADVPTPARPRLLGGFSFFGTDSLSDPWRGFEPATFHLPSVQIVIEDERTWVTVVGKGPDGNADRLQARLEAVLADLESQRVQDDPPDSEGELHIQSEELRSDRERWESRVDAITATIRSGGLRKAVLAQGLDITTDGPVDISRILTALGETYPDCYRFMFSGHRERHAETGEPGPFFFGASPEQLIGKQGSALSTEALAGTVARGETPEADETLEAHLQTDPKILEEHGLVVESIESQLDGIATDILIGDRGVRKLATVQHLQVPIRATATDGAHVLDIVEAMHPTPAVGGMPPDAAKAVIRESETVERGWYAAPVGWFDADGDGTFAVGIRSAVAQGNRATLFAGNGIVADSDPEEEWDEVTLKFDPIRTAIR